MIKQKFKPNKDRLKLQDINLDISGYSTSIGKDKEEQVRFFPLVYYYGVELISHNISKIIVDNNKFMPICYVCFTDVYNLMHDLGFPGDNAKLTIMLPTNHERFANIFMDFKIQKYKVDLTRDGLRKIHMWGICNVDGLLSPEYKSYPDTNSYDVFVKSAHEYGLGVMSNMDTSNDKMTWINPGCRNLEFLQDVTSKSWVGESGYVWSFLDLFYNLNYIDVEKSMSQEINDIKWISTDVIDSRKNSGNGDNAEVLAPVLTNEPAMAGSNMFFTGETILNQATDISLDRGYIRNVHFYDVDGNWSNKAGAYKVHGLDTITSPGSENNSIILKGEPGSIEFYKNNITNHYMGNIDTSNVYPDYLWAKVQNSENLYDLQKIIMQIVLPMPNYNIRRFEKIKLLFTNANNGIKNTPRNAKLSGEWLVTGQQFEWDGNTIYQKVNIVKRELSAGEL
jgi:hypothetical protein